MAATGNGHGSTAGHELLARVGRLVDAAMAAEARVGDEPGSLSLAALSAPAIAGLLSDAVECLIAVYEHFESLEIVTDDPDSLDDIGAIISTEVAAQEIRDLAFLAAMQIRASLRPLERAIGEGNLLAVVSNADNGVFRLRRGLIPVEAALADFEGVAVEPRQWADLGGSLQVRRLYGRLRREVAALGVPDEDDLEDRLREVRDRLGAVRSSQVFTSLRIGDRVQLRTLERRVDAWLAAGHDPGDETGRRLWQDLSTFVELLAEVNSRQELREHDEQVLDVVFHALYAAVRPPRLIPLDLLERLSALEGLDEELDRLILQGTNRNPGDWEGPIRRLRHEDRDGAGLDPLAPAVLVGD